MVEVAIEHSEGLRSMFVYVGSYTEGRAGSGKGISVYHYNQDNGALKRVQVVTGVPNPSYLAVDSQERFLFAVNELDIGTVSSFARDPETGELTPINTQPSGGAHPCYISVDPTDQCVLVANYTSGTVAALPFNDAGELRPAGSVIQHEGSSVNPDRQVGPHAHMIASSPDGRYVLATDLGADRIFVYQLDPASGTLTPNPNGFTAAEAEPGSGPRHFAFAPDGQTVYVINELSSSVTAWAWNDETGEMTAGETVSSLPDDFAGSNTCAHIVASPDGRHVYGSNRGHDSIAVWAVGEGGALSPAGYVSTTGREPRNFMIEPGGEMLFVANQNSHTLVRMRRNAENGLLQPLGHPLSVDSAVAFACAGYEPPATEGEGE